MGKKMIAPVIITLIVTTYFAGVWYAAGKAPSPIWMKILIGIASAALIGTAIFVLVERFNEIKKGSDDDDLGKY